MRARLTASFLRQVSTQVAAEARTSSQAAFRAGVCPGSPLREVKRPPPPQSFQGVAHVRLSDNNDQPSIDPSLSSNCGTNSKHFGDGPSEVI